jgi:hypothetical protein
MTVTVGLPGKTEAVSIETREDMQALSEIWPVHLVGEAPFRGAPGQTRCGIAGGMPTAIGLDARLRATYPLCLVNLEA